MYLYLADAARFSDCATGISYPVAQEGAAATLERAYLDARGGPGEPVFVTIRGRVATRPGMEGGPEDAVVIDSVESVSPDRGCGGNVPDRPLEDTQWVLTEVVAAPPIPGGARAMLRIDPEQQHISGSTGCNAYSGTYRLAGGQLDIALTGVTRRGCAPALARLEADFLEALRVTGSYRVRGDTLELLGEAGVVARFAAGS
jgi:heat shock protein HslJ